MENNKVFAMGFAKVYPLLVQKAERKGRTRDEVDAATCWLTGYTPEDVERCLAENVAYGDFFRDAPGMNPLRMQMTGSICGVKVQEITDPLMRDIRCLDKLVDDLAKGKPLEKVLPKGKE